MNRLDYRTRWQQKRRRRQIIRLAAIPVIVVVIALAVYGIRSLVSEGRAWTFQGPEDNIAVPAIRGNLLVTVFSEGQARCLRLVDGTPLWEKPLSLPTRFLAPAAIASGTVVIGSELDRIYGVHVTSGASRWDVEAEGPFRCAPLLVDGTAYLASAEGKIYCLDAETGARVHEPISTGRPLSGTPALIDGLLVAGASDGVVLGLEPSTGKIAWTRRLRVSLMSPTIQAGSFAAIGSDHGREYVIDPRDGTVKYASTLPGLIRTAAASDDEHLFFADSEGWVRCVDLRTGSGIWRRRIGRSLQAGPYYHSNRLYCLIEGDTVVGLSPDDGRIEQHWSGYEGAVDMAVGSGYFCVGSWDGRVHAVQLP